MRRRTIGLGLTCCAVLVCAAVLASEGQDRSVRRDHEGAVPETPVPWLPESPSDPPAVRSDLQRRAVSAPAEVRLGPYVSVQVNVDASGNNIEGDAANEPSIAIDATNPDRIVIGWRQFDSISSNFRQSGYGYSHDRGQTWTFPGVLEPNVFASDPVLDFDLDGNIYYLSLQPDRGPGNWACYLYRSSDGGVTWPLEQYAYGGDREWMAIDRTGGPGSGNIYIAWNPGYGCCPGSIFTRSTDGGLTFMNPIPLERDPFTGTYSVGPDGELYIVGGVDYSTGPFVVLKSTNAQNPAVIPTFDTVRIVSLGGPLVLGGGPNPGGLLGQVWVATDHSNGATQGNVYVLGSVDPAGGDPLDVMFSRSTDGGLTWSEPLRINDDPEDNGAWQWFGTMSVAPSGRIDVVWNDSRNSIFANLSELFYSFSEDGGLSWSANIPVSPMFDSFVGWPQQNKLGDYYDMISDNGGANLAWAATFNGEQDVYFLRIPRDCDGNGIDDDCDISCDAGGSRCAVPGCGEQSDCNNNRTPDDCEPDEDCNGNLERDICEIGADPDLDCNYNDIPDECEPFTDCNNNTVVDFCDIASGSSKDCNENDVPDDCDITGSVSDDDNGNGVPDECEGACCTCEGCSETTPVECSNRAGEFSEVGGTCSDTGACTPPPLPAQDDCGNAEALPALRELTIPIDNRCAGDDGPALVACPEYQAFGSDMWYTYVAPCGGTMTLSMCDVTDFDAIIAAYGGLPFCECPTERTRPLICGDDSCGVGGGPPTITVAVGAGACYTIRVGGWQSATGIGEVNVTFESAPVPLCDEQHVPTLNDHAFVVDCMTGPGGDIYACCGCGDLNEDSRIDLIDVAIFQRAYGGP